MLMKNHSSKQTSVFSALHTKLVTKTVWVSNCHLFLVCSAKGKHVYIHCSKSHFVASFPVFIFPSWKKKTAILFLTWKKKLAVGTGNEASVSLLLV